ncbi:MAG: CoA pyrophosphatase [Sulfolobales archaeon]|jgi:8-oxo-dGTP pyrophosphatase MutT (NUDIX family)|nr:CoA pyrophosphatase [Sulfolobales archaeon]MCQ4448273.1 CoA pyrophosphatase [Sulfolobales archaeon]MCQ4449150.1 CoA pyrophosphatase [Sulfolobales archaeon]
MIECDAAVVAFVASTGEVLLIKRAEVEGDPWSGQIALPGGHREPGETCEQAARREAYEEVGVSPKELKFLGMFSPHNRPVKVAAFMCCSERFEPVVSPGEISRAFWFSLSLINDSENYVEYDGEVIWGMTLRILKALKRDPRVLECQKGNDSS